MLTTAPLQGLGIVVTRPQHQATSLCQLLQNYGAQALRFPALAIVPPRDRQTAAAVMQRFDQFDLAIFISVNAIEQALVWLDGRLPVTVRVAVIGQASAQALIQAGREPDLMPAQDFNSEGLLVLPQLQELAGQNIVIVRGEGGREILAQTLRARGAEVCYAELYRRAVPELDVDILLKHWQHNEIHAVTVTSNESLQNLYDQLTAEGRSYLLATPLVVVSPRAKQLALQLGFKRAIIVAEQAGDSAIVAALSELFRQPPD